MSCKRRGNVILDYVEESSSEEENDDTRDFDYEMPSRSRSASRRQESMVSNSSSEPRRRGRAVSKRPCLNRNAQMARENRQRKKEYLEKLENKLSFYKQGNKNLANVVQRQRIDLKRLKAEVSYLKNVMNNSSSITKLLKSMNDTLSRKNNDKDNCCVEKNLWNQNDSGNSNSSEKHDDISPKVWKDNGRTPWQQGGKFIDSSATRNRPYEISAGNLKNLSLGDSDHTYTTSRESSIDEKLRNYDEIHAPCSVDSGVFSQIAGDRFISDLIPNSLTFKVPEEISELPQFDEDLFDSIGNEATNDSMEYFRNDSCNDTASNLFEGLENSGICLHVNSGKVSLEFCSICHLNSINSME